MHVFSCVIHVGLALSSDIWKIMAVLCFQTQAIIHMNMQPRC